MASKVDLKTFLDFVIHVVDGRQKHIFRSQDILTLAGKEIKAPLHPRRTARSHPH